MRLDDEASATKKRDSRPAIAPGRPEESEVWRRITSTDENTVMPPPDSRRTLSAEQKELIKRWIEAGAPFGRHWAFEPLRAAPPASKHAPDQSATHPIDAFVHEKLAERGLEPASAAEWRVLARRLSLDLIGLPPTPEEADAFARAAAENSSQAIDAFVEGRLASPRFGEHWARMWLDLARYADTFGPVGPYIVSGLDYDNLMLRLRLNGEVKQEEKTDHFIHDIPSTVSFISQYITLEPGDLIFTGTPGETSPIKPGDVVEVELEGVGVLKNPVVAEK